MSTELQQYVALALVAMAAGSLLWRFARPWFGGTKTHDCGAGCGSCPANKDAVVTEQEQPLVQLQPIMKKHGGK